MSLPEAPSEHADEHEQASTSAQGSDSNMLDVSIQSARGPLDGSTHATPTLTSAQTHESLALPSTVANAQDDLPALSQIGSSNPASLAPLQLEATPPPEIAFLSYANGECELLDTAPPNEESSYPHTPGYIPDFIRARQPRPWDYCADTKFFEAYVPASIRVQNHLSLPRGYRKAAHERERRAISEHREASYTVNELLLRLEQGNMNDAELRKGLLSTRRDLKMLNISLCSMVRPVVYQEYCPPHAICAAQKVFNVPELLESILIQLDFRGLLVVQSVSRQFRDMVDSASSLQRNLGLIPYLSKNFQSPFADSIGKYFEFEVEDLHNQRKHDGEDYSDWAFDDTNYFLQLTKKQKMRTLLIRIEPKEAYRTIGRKARRMFVTHPPIKEIKAITKCCVGDRAGVMSNSCGITIGDLLALTEHLDTKHGFCRDADPAYLDARGAVVDLTLTFRAVVTLDIDDPIVVSRQKEVAKRKRDRRFRKSMKAFDTAEWKAIRSGGHVPDRDTWIAAFHESEDARGGKGKGSPDRESSDDESDSDA